MVKETYPGKHPNLGPGHRELQTHSTQHTSLSQFDPRSTVPSCSHSRRGQMLSCSGVLGAGCEAFLNRLHSRKIIDKVAANQHQAHQRPHQQAERGWYPCWTNHSQINTCSQRAKAQSGSGKSRAHPRVAARLYQCLRCQDMHQLEPQNLWILEGDVRRRRLRLHDNQLDRQYRRRQVAENAPAQCLPCGESKFRHE